MPTGSLSRHVITADSVGNIYLVPSGSVTTGTSQSVAVAQVVEISMSANTNNYHTPVNDTGSFFLISGSTNPEHFYTVAYTSEEVIHKHRILPGPNSSSLTSSYGSQGGKHFEFTASRQGYDTAKFKVWYSNPGYFTRATSSVITISSFSGSQSNQYDNQYMFILSASAGKVFHFIPSSSVTDDAENARFGGAPTGSGGISIPIQYFYTSSVSNSIDEFGDPLTTQFFLSSSRTQGVSRIADIINASSSYFGVTATASLNTIQFSAVTIGPLSDTLAFITQSLTGSHSGLKTFPIAGGTHVTSSSPALSGCDYLIEVPIGFSASIYDIATASRDVINSNNHTASFMSASVSGSESDLYGLVIAGFKPGYLGYVTGSTNPTFTFDIAQSGSKNILPNIDYRVGHIIEVPVENNATTARMISQSILSINNFTGGTTNAGQLVGSGSDNYLTDTMYISASYCSNPDAFRITNLYGGAVNDVSMSDARITASIIVSGSGEFSAEEIIGTANLSEASARFQIDIDAKSFILSGSGNQLLYMSGSGGGIGFNTTEPIRELDFRADEMQFSRKSEQKGMRITRDGDLESFNFDAASSATGSELIMTYQAGGSSALSATQIGETVQSLGLMLSAEFIDITDTTYEGDPERALLGIFRPADVLKILDHAQQLGFFGQASVGDNIGTIRWAVQSGSGDSDIRGAGEAATIKGIVTGVADDTGGVTSKLDFSIAKISGDAASKLFSIDPQVGIICSSSLVLRTGDQLIVGSADADGTDRSIRYRHATAPFIMGVDDSRNVFAIHGAASFNASGTNEFEISAAGSATFKYSVFVTNQLHVSAYTRTDALRVGTTATAPANGDAYIEGNITNVGSIKATSHITASGNISSSGTIYAESASFSNLKITDTNIVGRRHILFNSPIYINDNPLLVDNGYFGSSLANTPANWNDPTAASFDSSAGTFEDVIDITEDEHGSKTFFAPFPVSRIEVLSSWRTAGTGDQEKFWCGIWTGSAGVRLGVTSSAHNTVKNIGFVTGSIHEFFTGGDWNGHNNDIDFTFETPLPPFTQIYYGMGTGETSSVGTKNIRGYITMMVYEA